MSTDFEPPRHLSGEEPDGLLLANFVVATIALGAPGLFLYGPLGVLVAICFTSSCMVVVCWRRRRYRLITPMAAAAIWTLLATVALLAFA